MIGRELALIDGPRVKKFAMANTEIPDRRPPPYLVKAQSQMSMWAPLIGHVLRSKFDNENFLKGPEGFGGSFHDPAYVLGDFRKYILKPIVDDEVRTEGHRRFFEGWNWKRLDQMKRGHASLRMPVLLVWGEDDETFPLKHAEEMKLQFPNCVGMVTLPKTKLLVHEERPELLGPVLVKFFSAGDAPRAVSDTP